MHEIYTNSMTPNPILIAVDHGYGQIKTVNTVFPSAVLPCVHEPAFSENILEWFGRKYIIGAGHKEFAREKDIDEDYRLLTMAAIAMELDRLRLTEAKIYLAVGLPLGWAGEQKNRFRDYLLFVPMLEFSFNNKVYSVEIVDVLVFPQGFSAVADQLEAFSGMNMLCDIGNGTVSLMFIHSGRPVPGKVFTEQLGVHQCAIAIRDAVSKRHGKISDVVIEEFIRTGKADVSEELLQIMRRAAGGYVRDVMRYVHEHDFDPAIMKLYALGGGACLLPMFGDETVQEEIRSGRIILNRDVNATAKGYDRLARKLLEGRGVYVL